IKETALTLIVNLLGSAITGSSHYNSARTEVLMRLPDRLTWYTTRSLLIGALLVSVRLSVRAQEPGTVVAADKRAQGRSYVFAGTGKQIPYAVFVPFTYSPAKKWPLMVGLHGLGRPYDWLMGYDGIIDFAERDGYVLVTP